MLGYYIKYKFLVPSNTKHSSYLYQKLFRALYGYTQVVIKSNGKTYRYHRPGVLSNSPYISVGRNRVIISPEVFSYLVHFFETGENPAHKWSIKGNWKVKYDFNEKQLDIKPVVLSLESWLDRVWLHNNTLVDELKQKINSQLLKEEKNQLIAYCNKIYANSWFKSTYKYSQKLKEFKELYDRLRTE